MRHLILMFLMMGVVLEMYSQPGQLWTKDFETKMVNHYSDNPSAAIFGDTIRVTGRKNTSDGQQLFIVNYSLDGDTISTYSYGKDSVSNSIIVDYIFDDSNFVYILQQDYLEYYKSRIVLQKYSLDDSLVWVEQIQSLADTSYEPHSIGLINDTCIMLTAYKEYNYPGQGDDVINTTRLPRVYAIETKGNQLWERQFNSDSEIEMFFHKIIPCDNEALLFGTNYSTRFCFVKVGMDNELVVLNDIEIDHGMNVVQFDADSNLLIASGSRYQITKLDLNGHQIWSTNYGTNLPPNNIGDEIRSLIQDGEGNIYVTGRHYGKGHGTDTYTNADILTLKYDKNGKDIWQSRYEYGVNNGDIGNIAILKDGYVYVGGESQRGGMGSDLDYVVLKIDSSSGVNQGAYRFGGMGDGDDAVSSVAIFDNGYVVLTGLSFMEGIYNSTTQLLSDVITSIPFQTIGQDILVFPNPILNGGLLTIENSGFSEYNLCSITGIMVKFGYLQKERSSTIKIKGLSKGIYILTLKNSENVYTQKLLVQ